jgi:hypothetical protein
VTGHHRPSGLPSALLSIVVALVAACSGDEDALRCDKDEDCAGARCLVAEGRCAAPSVDAGASATDAGQRPDAGRDAGATPDASELDAGSGGDAGAEVDAGDELDAGDDLDARDDLDAGAEADASADDEDAAAAADDAAEPADASAAADAGAQPDAAADPDAGLAPDAGPDPEEQLEWVFSLPTGLEFTRSEVTVAQFGACLREGGCSIFSVERTGGVCNFGNQNRRLHPLNCVDWIGADAFCRWAGGRLPDEFEWYGEAAGGMMRTYAWGQDPPTCMRTVMFAGGSGCGRASTWPVCSKRLGDSVSGLCDVTGNVWEWTSTDLFGGKVFRGGSWDDSLVTDLAVDARYQYTVGYRLATIGFRCVRDVGP